MLLVVTGLGILGAVGNLVRSRKRIGEFPWEQIGILGVLLAAVWGAALMRGVSWLPERLFIPAARYAYPVVIPTLLILTIGWYWWMRRLEQALRLPAWIKWAVFFGFFLVLDVWSLVSVYVFFYAGGPV